MATRPRPKNRDKFQRETPKTKTASTPTPKKVSMAIEPKPVVASKMAWLGTLVGFSGIALQFLETPEMQKLVAEHAPEGMVFLGTAIVVLRFMTKGPVAFIVRKLSQWG